VIDRSVRFFRDFLRLAKLAPSWRTTNLGVGRCPRGGFTRREHWIRIWLQLRAAVRFSLIQTLPLANRD
jgi:hypothetical protein